MKNGRKERKEKVRESKNKVESEIKKKRMEKTTTNEGSEKRNKRLEEGRKGKKHKREE